MQLTGLIFFFAALIFFLLWLLKLLMNLFSTDTYINMRLGGKVTFNILPGIISFIVMAISAGMAWG